MRLSELTFVLAWQRVLQSCGLLSAREPRNCNARVGGEFDCQYNCALRASCEDLEANWCDDMEIGGFGACLEACYEVQIQCGDGTSVSARLRCNYDVDYWN